MKKTLLLGLALIPLVGCGAFGPNPSHPTKFEEGIFTTTTNIVQQVVTNLVTVTNVVPVTVTRTNEVGVLVTNVVFVSQLMPQYVTLTNTHEEYTLTPKPVVAETAGAAGAISNLVLPGSGGLVAGIIAGLAAAWAKLRSAKQVGTSLAQDIETIREFLKTIPNGAKYDSQLVQFMQKHQAETGVLTQVIGILQNNVSNKDAQIAAQEVANAIATLAKV